MGGAHGARGARGAGGAGGARGFGSRTPPDGVTGMPSIDQLANAAKTAQLSDLLGEYEKKEKKVFDDKLTFPTKFMLKVVGANEPTFVEDVVKAITSCVGEQPLEHIPFKLTETAGGKYVSISIEPVFSASEELYAVYDVVAKDSRVKFML
jgi:putative lipoic acid-binding regulatory protein